MPQSIEPTSVIRHAFPEMSQKEALEMVGLGTMRHYAENVVLCHEGAIETTFFLIIDGQVKVTKVINEEEERFLCYLRPGDFFGEMALIHRAPRTASVITTAPSTVLEVDKEHFDDLVRRNSSVSVAMVREVSRRLRENNDLAIEDLRMKAGELASAYQQLAEMEYARSEFLTVVAHELRTPLTVAKGFLQMIRSQKLQGEDLNKAVDTVASNIQEIISLTNDILFLQEMDFILTEFQPVDIGELVTRVVEPQRSLNELGAVNLIVDVPPDLPKISGDEKSLERAFEAIFDNAIKFSPLGGDVHIEVGFDSAEVWIKVADQGVGIPPEALPHVFERYFHLEEVQGYLFRGVGLGLSIARQVIQQHKGKIDVESCLGEGSTFTIHLPR